MLQAEVLPNAKLTVRIARTKVDMPPAQPGEPTPTLVTECWVEGCCFEQRLLDPDATLVFRPLSVPCPIPGAENLLVHISGFPTETTVYLKRLLKTVGGVLSEKLNRRTTHLVCAVPEGQKWTKAHEWGVTCVKDSWLWDMGRTGVIDDVANHLHGADMNGAAPTLARSAVASGEGLSSANEISGSSLSARGLKSTPTHVDKSASNVLQSPKASTERLLNRANTVPERSPGRKGTPGASAAISSPSALGSGSGSDVTAALRRLAEGPDAPTRSKVVSQIAVLCSSSVSVPPRLPARLSVCVRLRSSSDRRASLRTSERVSGDGQARGHAECIKRLTNPSSADRAPRGPAVRWPRVRSHRVS